jgi:hypothetical protein
MAELIMAEGVTPATPSTGKATVFVNANGILCWVDDAGNVYAVAYNNQTITFTSTVTINKMVYGAGATLTIASGAITVTHSRHVVDTEGAAASDDLDTINGGTDGQVLFLTIASGARDVVVRHNVGNILTATGANITMGTTSSTLMLQLQSSFWREVERQ